MLQCVLQCVAVRRDDFVCTNILNGSQMCDFFLSTCRKLILVQRLTLAMAHGQIDLHGTMRCSVWQCVAVCCSALQCVAVRCSVLQRIIPTHENHIFEDHYVYV